MSRSSLGNGAGEANAQIVCKLASGNVEMTLEQVANIFETNPGWARLNRYLDLRTQQD